MAYPVPPAPLAGNRREGITIRSEAADETRWYHHAVGPGSHARCPDRWVTQGSTPVFDDHSFALCLTHDLDRLRKDYRSLYYAFRDRRPSHLRDLLPGRNPYWQFETMMELEEKQGVRSAVYVLNEPHILRKGLQAFLRPADWVQHLGRYDLDHPALGEALETLDAGGWEIGIHGSFRSHTDRDRLRHEKEALEQRLGRPVWGGRQHYMQLRVPETWRHHAAIGLRYDSSLGTSTTYGFHHGYRPLRPFHDDFVVFPLTVMEQALPDPDADFEAAWSACEGMLQEAAENEAVMTALWHPRFFSEADFPGYRRLYRRLIERGHELGAWIGSPGDCYRNLDIDADCIPGYDHVTGGLTKGRPGAGSATMTINQSGQGEQ